jgi:hypothetical protein
MSSSTTILKSTDVAKFTAINVNMNTCTFADIFAVEYNVFVKFLGFDFRTDLVAALANYSAAPNYNAATTYDADTAVKYKGRYYISLEENTGIEPNTAGKWKLAPRFDTSTDCGAKYEAFFCDFLGPYLANCLLDAKVAFIWSQIHDVGAIQYNGASYSSTDDNAYTRLKRAISNDIRVRLDNLKHHLTKNYAADACFANFLDFTGSEDCNTLEEPGGKNRTYGGWNFG